MHYSPSIDPNDLDKFIQITFNSPKQDWARSPKLKGTALKYYNCLRSFLKIVYSSGYSQLNPEFGYKGNYSSNDKEEMPSLLEEVNDYIELSNIKYFEDAFIIHLMYSIGANTETISFLTFESINEDNILTYFETKTLKYRNVKLNENLGRDIKFLKELKQQNKKSTSDISRCYQDKLVIWGEFIISVSTGVIYNRFSRHFGGMIRWFKYTPQQIIKLSNAIFIIKKLIDPLKWLNLVEDAIQFSQEKGRI